MKGFLTIFQKKKTVKWQMLINTYCITTLFRFKIFYKKLRKTFITFLIKWKTCSEILIIIKNILVIELKTLIKSLLIKMVHNQTKKFYFFINAP